MPIRDPTTPDGQAVIWFLGRRNPADEDHGAQRAIDACGWAAIAWRTMENYRSLT